MTRWLPLVILALASACSDAGAVGPVTIKQTCETPDTGVEYPPCPYSDLAPKGGVVPNKKFLGRMGGIDTPREEIDFARLHALRKQGKKYAIFNVAAWWCSPCKEEAKELQNIVLPKYGPRGAVIVSVILQDARKNPTVDRDVDLWMDNFSSTFTVVRDVEGWTSRIFDANTMPFNMLIDLETMKVEERAVGGLKPILDKLDALLAQ